VRPVLAAGIAFGAAVAYAVASVLQHHAATRQPAALSMRAGLLVQLASRPAWLAGIGADVTGFVLQFVALGMGSLAVVQPVLVSGLLVALPLGALVARRQLTHRDWVAAGAIVVGLAGFLVVAHPADGVNDVRGRTWLIISIALLVPAAALVAAAPQRFGRERRARCLAAAAGLVYAFTAALTKTTAHLLSRGLGPLVRAWPPYALLGAGVVGMLLAQSAFQAATLDASLPTLSVVDPLASVVVGALAFHEAIANSPAALFLEMVAVALIVAGVLGTGSALERASEAAAV
jgi:drug/metabolite transporter (DMT)-like permease